MIAFLTMQGRNLIKNGLNGNKPNEGYIQLRSLVRDPLAVASHRAQPCLLFKQLWFEGNLSLSYFYGN